MDKIIIYYNEFDTLKYTTIKDAINNIYHNENDTIPTEDQIKTYIKKNKKDSITSFFKNDIDDKILLIKNTISYDV